MREVKSVCRYCCGACGVIATLDEEERIVSLRGDKQNALSQGFACIRGLQSAAAMYSPDRILRPLKKTEDGCFVEIPLETALDEIAERLDAILKESGGESLALFAGTQSWKNVTAYNMLNGWLPAFDSTRYFTTITIDQSCKQVTMRRMGWWDAGKHRLADSDVLMVVGGNPLVSVAFTNLCYDPVKRLKAALKRGMTLIVIDPRRSETAEFAHCYVQPKPGEDPTFIAGVLRVILERGWHDQAFCDRYVEGLDTLRAAVDPFTPQYVAVRAGVSPEQVEDVARLFALENKRGVAAAGTGPSMSPHSNLADHLVECLNVICGRVYREGEEIINPGVQNKRRPYRAEVIPPHREWETSPKTSTGHGTLFGELMSVVLPHEILRTDPGRIRAMFVNGGNPAVALPDQEQAVKALQALDLLVAVEPFMTATARLCDYVLPPKLQFERTDTAATPKYESLYDLPFAQYVPAVCEPPPGSDVADDWYFYWAIAKRLGRQITFVGQPLDMETTPTSDELLAIALRDSQAPFEEIRQHPEGHVFDIPKAFVEPPRPEAVARFDIMPDDVRADLEAVLGEWDPDVAAPRPVEPEAGAVEQVPFDLLLTPRRLRGTMNSLGIRLPEIRRRHPYNAAHVHPDDLADLGLEDGAEIEIYSERGHAPAIAQADETMRRGVVSMSHCWGWLPDEDLPYTEVGASTNRLVSAERYLEPINAMARMSSIPIRIEPRLTNRPHVQTPAVVRETTPVVSDA